MSDDVQVIAEAPRRPASAQEAAQIDMQIETAHRYPRSVSQFLRDVETLACLDADTAAACFYALPRKGKVIEGPSVRLAEIIASCWRNLRWASWTQRIDDRYVVARGYAWDLERNVAVEVECRRRITNRDGRRYNDDMIGVTAQAAQSVALRNALFRVIPTAIVKTITDKAKAVSLGEGQTHEERVAMCMAAWSQLGVDQADVLQAIGAKGLEDISVDDLITLRGAYGAVKSGEYTLDQVLHPEPEAAGGSRIKPSAIAAEVKP